MHGETKSGSQSMDNNGKEWEKLREDGYENLDDIDVSTTQGELDFVDALIENDTLYQKELIEQADMDGNDEAGNEAKRRLATLKRMKNAMLNIDLSGSDGVMGGLLDMYQKETKKNDSMSNPSEEVATIGMENEQMILSIRDCLEMAKKEHGNN